MVGDGRMEKIEYYCIFDKKQPCPVKEEYKLKPESLNEFCKICNFAPANLQEKRMVFDVLMQMTQVYRELGQKTAEADIYKKLYEDAQR